MNNHHNELPGITIITPTHKRDDLVTQLLSSLQIARKFYSGPSEVIIVDSSPGLSGGIIQNACKEYDAIYQVMPNNVREKRNWGINNAHYPIILFIDSDCIADKQLLVEHAKFYIDTYDSDLGGVVGLTNFVGKDNWVWQVIQRSSTMDAFSYPNFHIIVPWGPTCNISYRRDVLEEVGLFDTTFPFILGGDDTDLGLRVTDLGHKIVTNKYAIVEHEKRTWTRIYDIVQRRFRWGKMHFYLMQKHPHRVFIAPPTQITIFLTLLILFLPFAFITGYLFWAFLPLFWIILEFLLEAILIGRGKGPQPSEFFYSIGATILSFLYQLGTVLEGAKNCSHAPLFKDASITPPSKDGRSRGVAQIWAKIFALPVAVLVILLLQILLGK